MRLIDADALMKKICKYNETGCGSCNFQTGCPVDQPTVDAVPVVRCKDCRHRIEGTKMCEHPKAIGWDAIEPEDDDFCSYGEKKVE